MDNKDKECAGPHKGGAYEILAEDVDRITGFSADTAPWIPCLDKYQGNTAQKKAPDAAKYDIMSLWINR